MRILLVADFYPPAPGGLEAHVRRLGRELRARGHQVTVVAGGGTVDGVVDDGGVRVLRLPSGVGPESLHQRADRAFHPPWAHGTFRAGLRAVVDSVDPHVVHAHGWCGFSAAAVAGPRPVVVTLHDHGLRCPKKNLLRGGSECRSGRGVRCVTCPGPEQAAVKRSVLSAALGATVPRLVRRVDRFVAVSRHVAERFGEASGHVAERFGEASGHTAERFGEASGHTAEVIPNFLDLPPDGFTPPRGDGVLFVGPADRHKGLRVLLRAWRDVPSGHLTVVGDDGPPGGIDRVTFAGRLTGGPLWTRYRSAALVVVPPIWPEPCPTVVLEALAYGRPVVASRIGGIPDLVVDGVSGVLVPPGDPSALAVAVAELLADPRRLSALAEGAYARAREFSTPVVVDRIEALYTELLADRVVLR